MKVILKKDVGGVGARDSVKEVSDGYALNFLIPNGLAEQATPEKVSALESRKRKESSEHTERSAQWEEALKKINGSTAVVHAKANDTGRLYREVKGEDVAKSIKKEAGIDIPADAIHMSSVKKVGEYKATIELGPHRAELTVSVRAG